MDLTREEQFFLSCIKTDLSEKEINDLNQILLKGINVNEIIKLSKYHGTFGSLYLNLKKTRFPKKGIKELEELFIFSSSRNLVLRRELFKLAGKLNKKDINAVLLKGWALKETLGDDFESQADIDLLVRKEDFPLIERELEAMGYKCKKTIFYGFLKNYYTHISFFKKIGPINVLFELHRHLVFPINSFSINLDNLRKDSAPIKENKSLLVFSPEDQLIHFSLHLVYSHAFFLSLPNLLKMRRVIKKCTINWNKLVERAIESNVSEILCHALFLEQEFFGEKIPESVMNKLRLHSDRKKLKYLNNFNVNEILKINSSMAGVILLNCRRTFFKFYWTKGLKDKLKIIPFIKSFWFEQ
ncbi:MAG: nucleotidyltransferase family protein [archaeon]